MRLGQLSRIHQALNDTELEAPGIAVDQSQCLQFFKKTRPGHDGL